MRGVARGYHTMARAWSLFCLSLVLVGALCLLNASYGAPDHDPILVMRLLRPILVRNRNDLYIYNSHKTFYFSY